MATYLRSRCQLLRAIQPGTSGQLLRRVSTGSYNLSSSAAAAEAPDGATGPSERVPSSPWWRATKAVFWTISLAVGGATAYTTYSYRTDEVEEALRNGQEKAKAQRAAVRKTSGLQKLMGGASLAASEGALAVGHAYLDARKNIEEYVEGFSAPSSDKLLPDLPPNEAPHIYTLVVDLNETLIYSDWKRERGWRTFKRPGVDAFLEQLGQMYEIVVYSDQLNLYVDPICERLDSKGFIRHRLYRDATHYQNGKHWRDLTKLNRDPTHIIYLSAHAPETCLQPENSVPISPWKLEPPDDTELLDLIPFLEFVARQAPPDTRQVLGSFQGKHIPTEFRERTKEYQRRMKELRQRRRPFLGGSPSTAE